ncbi:hypothetical protein [Paraburkholderia strydomiana]|uniref:hypothetical protein n=1 Tax=Paraburkholderia strydomiana TaxID=1245417 RepID=UPI0038BAAB5F
MTGMEEIKIDGIQTLPAQLEGDAAASQMGSVTTANWTLESSVDYDWMDHALPFRLERLDI